MNPDVVTSFVNRATDASLTMSKVEDSVALVDMLAPDRDVAHTVLSGFAPRMASTTAEPTPPEAPMTMACHFSSLQYHLVALAV